MDQTPLLPESRRRPGALGSQRLLVVFWPVLALAVLAAVVAAIAGLAGWHPTAMLIAVATIGVATLAFAVFLIYCQAAEQRAAHHALHDVQARVGGVIESAMDAIITVDRAQRIVLFNDAAERVFRWPRQAVLGQPLDRLLPARFHEAHRRHIEQFGKTGVTARRMGAKTVLTGVRANAEEFPVEASISQFGEGADKLYTVILRDISERVRAEEQLAHSEARLRGILDSAMDAIITVDERQHVVLFNAAAEAVFGCPREEAIGAPLAWFIPERFRTDHVEHIRRFGTTATGSRRMAGQRIVTGLRRNGEEFPIDASISQITEHGQKFYTVILRDVTERVRAEQALRWTKEELREFAAAANQLREQDQRRVARELHDELAQALTGLKMDVAWIKDQLAAPPAIGAKLESMEQLLDTTVAATRRISADLRPLMLDDLGLVPAAEWLVQNFTERTGIRCQLAIAEGDHDLGDPHATTAFRILQESLTNVAKHAQAQNVEVRLAQKNGEIVINVRDDGVGFAPQDPRKPNSYGLIGMRERAYLVGGQLRIDSTPGRGTSIEVRLPIDDTRPRQGSS
jgi:hypothetical protein